jgi:5'-nucleotidase
VSTAPGIRTLAQLARQAGLEVVVAAPAWDASGSSASLSAVEDGGRFRVEERDWDGDGIGAVFAVEAAPAFIVRAALSGAFGPPPDVVVSGINRGFNTGHAVLHSGTVGAALTACNHGRRALAVSIGDGDPIHWETAGEIAGRALRWVLDAQVGAVLNVNVPNRAPGHLGGFQRARLAAVGAVQATVADRDQGYVKLTFQDSRPDLEPGTDTALLAEGVACFTPIRAVCEAHEVVTDGLGGRP